MTVRVDRSFELQAPPERVWAFIADPEKRARAISVVTDYTAIDPEGRKATWHLKVPLPLVTRTVDVSTEDVTRRPPEYVKFVGRSSLLDVTGEHEIVEIDGGTRLENTFVVDGHLPGVERFFKRNLDSELDNLKRALERDLEEST
ncbi:CoxG family protein [Natronosalvus vescus]|uniref:CoxG family protein n=1 Tax=Natronosalvus vescus TaxID=2953881 RepID=UPI002091BAA9|nr:SRPBCC family protein [Natronosalvus vescus]